MKYLLPTLSCKSTYLPISVILFSYRYYGLISGAAFTIAFSVSGVFAGQLVDKYSRRILLGIACILWSASNLVTGTVNSFALMIAMRFLLGVLQSFNNPSSLTLLADYFPLERRSTVNSVQNAGIYIGSGLSSLGKLLIYPLNFLLGIIAIRNKGWRWLFNLMGSLGILVGISILLFVKEPERGRYQPKILEEVKDLKSENNKGIF